MAKAFLLVSIVLAAYIAYKLHNAFQLQPLPKIESRWWGPGKPGSVSPNIRPFKIEIPEEDVKDLQWRLDHHRPFTPPLEGIAQQYGMNTKLLDDIVEYWRTKYSWRTREKYFNKFPQFKINIQGLDIHYLHVKPKAGTQKKVFPLLLLHGWPGSVREFYDILPLLTTPQKDRDFVFEVIVPHIPGYGFSQAASKPGLSPAHIALVFKNMMRQLNFEKFYIQGGDFGSIIHYHLAILFPENVLGFHSNMCTASSPKAYIKHVLSSILPSLPWWYVKPEHYDRVFPLKEKAFDRILETGYLHMQATKPDTIGVALNDSPVGLAAYILEKFTTGTNRTCKADEDGCLKRYFSYDHLLDNVMVYWWTKSATTSFRLYSETFNLAQSSLGITNHPITVPAACARFSNDFYASDGLLRDVFPNLLQLSDLEGGHFAAFQLPEVLAKDVFSAVQKFEEFNKARS